MSRREESRCREKPNRDLNLESSIKEVLRRFKDSLVVALIWLFEQISEKFNIKTLVFNIFERIKILCF